MRILQNLASQWLATCYVAFISLPLVFFLGRILGPQSFGVYSYILSVITIFAILLDGGYKTLLFRERTSQSQWIQISHDQLIANATGHILMVALGGVVLMLFFPVPYQMELLAALFCFVLNTVCGLVSAELKGRGRFQTEAVWQVIIRTTTAICIAMSLIILPTVSGVLVAWGIGLGVALFLPLARQVWLRRISLSFKSTLLRSCLAFLLIDVFTAIYFRVDMILLRHLGGTEEQVGNYAAAYRLLDGMMLLAAPVAHIAFRHLRLRWQNRTKFRELLIILLIVMFLSSLLLIVSSFLIGPLIVQATFGDDYVQAGMLIGWLFCAFIFILPNFILTQAAIAANKEVLYAYGALISVFFNILLNLWLIPTHGALGAAWATLATEGLLLIWLSFGLLGMKELRTG